MRPLLLAAALLTAPALAQAPADTLDLVPGDGALVTDWLEAGTRDYTIRLVRPMQQDVGSATETITLEGGLVTRATTVRIPMQAMTQVDSLVADAATLAPRLHQSTGGPSDASLEFMDEGIAGLITPQTGDPKTILLMADAPVFDAAWMGEIAQSLPLEPGLVARVEAYATLAPDDTFETFLVVGDEEAYETADGERTAVPVSVDMGPLTMTYRIDVETRALLSTRFSPQPGVEIEILPAD